MVELERISSGLALKDDGIWYALSDSATSYPEDGNECLAQFEDSSFWFRHRNECIVSLIRSYPPSPGGAVFDIGGGNGYVSRVLVDAGFDVVLVEPDVLGARMAMQRGLENVVCSTLRDARFATASLPAVGLFDVVEHLDDDVSFLRTVHVLLAPRGRIYITVPAYSWLWSVADVSAGHYRRYTVKSMTELLASTGFEVEFSSYFFRFLPLPIFLLRALPTRLGLVKHQPQHAGRVSRDHASGSSMTRQLLRSLLAPEVRHVQRSQAMRFGGACLIAATKT